jgi:two-component system, OmpR family, response regulator RegX3
MPEGESGTLQSWTHFLSAMPTRKTFSDLLPLRISRFLSVLRLSEQELHMSSHVMVVDNDRVNSRVIELVLKDAEYSVEVMQIGEQALDEILRRTPDLAVIDVEVNGLSGFEFCKQLRSGGYLGPVIFTSSRGEVELKLEAFRIGADDFIVKPFDPLEFVARVHSVIRRSRVSDEHAQGTIVQVENAELHIGRLTYKSNAVSPVVLTPTEMKILECLMRNHHITISRTTLIERVWGYDFLGDTNRIDVYIRRIRRKIEVNPATPEYLHTVRGLGYVFKYRPIASTSEESPVDLASNAQVI